MSAVTQSHRNSSQLRSRALTALAVAAIGSSALIAAGSGEASASTARTAAAAPVITKAATFKAAGSIGQAYVLNAKKGDALILADSKGKVVKTGTADAAGSLIFRDLTAATGYTVRLRSGSTVYGSKAFEVLGTTKTPATSLYSGQKLKQGLNYVRMRDGVELAMTVRLPTGKRFSDAPFPTIVEYSGYQTAAPKDLYAAMVVSSLTHKPIPAKDLELLPASSTAVGAVIGPLLGFAVVSVQMRGSGCSGGAFDLFDLPTTYDGYDAIETVASQSWVKGHKVGMGGISFSGITQLFTAGTKPPHLAAITPMSVTDDTYTATGYPGGIPNSGFARSWITERMDDAKPAPGGGQPWAKALTKAGDAHCIANQKLRLQTQDAVAMSDSNPFRTPALFNQRAAGTWMKKISVPTFLIGQFQDEQTGGHFIESLSALAPNKDVWVTLQNGVHADSLGPSTITRWAEFLKLFVANEIPKIPTTVMNLSSSLYASLADSPAAPVKQSRFATLKNTPANVAAAKTTFRKDPRIRLLMDNGASQYGSGSIGASWELGYSAWPIPQAFATTYYLGADGLLSKAAPSSETTASYTGDPSARPDVTLSGIGAGDAWKAQPRYNWAPIASGKGLGFTSAALTSDVVIGGPSSLDLTLSSSAVDTDLQVTLSEVRPDGKETYVQNGWLRASHRKLDLTRSTVLDPFPTHLASDALPLTPGVATAIRVPIYPVAHAFRAGSKIRVTIEAPGGDRPSWSFRTLENGSIVNTLTLGGATPSKLVLPVLTGAVAAKPLPAATALRGQPSRTYVVASNEG